MKALRRSSAIPQAGRTPTDRPRWLALGLAAVLAATLIIRPANSQSSRDERWPPRELTLSPGQQKELVIDLSQVHQDFTIVEAWWQDRPKHRCIELHPPTFNRSQAVPVPATPRRELILQVAFDASCQQQLARPDQLELEILVVTEADRGTEPFVVTVRQPILIELRPLPTRIAWGNLLLLATVFLLTGLLAFWLVGVYDRCHFIDRKQLVVRLTPILVDEDLGCGPAGMPVLQRKERELRQIVGEALPLGKRLRSLLRAAPWIAVLLARESYSETLRLELAGTFERTEMELVDKKNLGAELERLAREQDQAAPDGGLQGQLFAIARGGGVSFFAVWSSAASADPEEQRVCRGSLKRASGAFQQPWPVERLQAGRRLNIDPEATGSTHMISGWRFGYVQKRI